MLQLRMTAVVAWEEEGLRGHLAALPAVGTVVEMVVVGFMECLRYFGVFGVFWSVWERVKKLAWDRGVEHKKQSRKISDC